MEDKKSAFFNGIKLYNTSLTKLPSPHGISGSCYAVEIPEVIVKPNRNSC